VIDERPNRRAIGKAIANLESGHCSGQLFSKYVIDVSMDIDAVGANTGLARIPELRGHQAGDRLVQVGVIEDDERSVAAEFEAEPLEGGRALGGKQATDTG